MTISYKWLCDYLPIGPAGIPASQIEPERLSRILTAIGLEVENMLPFEEVKGGLNGLVIGEVLSTGKHPNADKLTLTQVSIGGPTPLQIVCGAPNVAAGQKVVVAPVGATIYPTSGDPLTMKTAKIRGVESQGMICAEDEIGLGDSHAGILVLPASAKVGTAAPDYFQPYQDIIYEIGLTPNRMDAMSHWGVARDVCAYLNHHDKKDIRPKLPVSNGFKADQVTLPISVEVINETDCPRYSGVSITNVKVGESPAWLKQKLKAIGIRSINNIVDITNFIQHETGQPLHAFDADKLIGNRIVVKNLPEGTPFITLDGKERTLFAEDLMICLAPAEPGDPGTPLCIAGVFGGANSGVTETTTKIFLESACFNGVSVRKTSFRHGLRTEAATRFEKGTDISATVTVLKRAALLIKEIAGGEIASDIVDHYPHPKAKMEVAIKYHYIKKITGKNYHPDAIRTILTSLGFEILKEGIDELRVAVPYHKPDISLPADLVEEILRIDGLDNVEIPESITITPSVEEQHAPEAYREKIADFLAAQGFNEMMTNSITNAAYFSEEELASMVRMLNSLSSELNVMRNSLFETALEAVAHNLNHKNNNLRLFEFGKAYSTSGPGKFSETEKLCIVISGHKQEDSWRQKAVDADFYTLKGMVDAVLKNLSIVPGKMEVLEVPKFSRHIVYKLNDRIICGIGEVKKSVAQRFGIKQPVFFAGLDWAYLSQAASSATRNVEALPKYPVVERDLAIVISKERTWQEVETLIRRIKLNKLQELKLFDIFESDKLGANKKSMAVSVSFLDNEKTLTDKEVDGWMNKIMQTLEKELQAEIRK